MYNENKGFKYEKIAKKYLVDNGYNIVKENFSCRFGEIDIIASRASTLHFIEVKGRKNTNFGYPREAVTAAKQKRIIAAANYYLMCMGSDDIPCQFDVIEIISDIRKINNIENAFWN